MTEETDRVAHYRQKAEQARALARSMSDGNARATTLDVAATWERLAEEEEKNQEKYGRRPDAAHRSG